MEEKQRFTTEGLVIKTKSVGENDRLITILTRDRGVINAFASGAKAVKSRKGAATGLLAYSSFSVIKKNDTYKIYEAAIQKIFFGAGIDIRLLSLAQYFCELAAAVVPAETESEEFLRLILNSLHFLLSGKRLPELVKAITELRLASLSGFMPDLVACSDCGLFENDIMYFYPYDGRLRCPGCKKAEPSYAVNQTQLSAMRHIAFSEFALLYNFKIPEADAIQLSHITERYIAVQTERKYTTLDLYYRSL